MTKEKEQAKRKLETPDREYRKRIFLAIPYTGVEEYSHTISEQYTLKLMDAGYNVFHLSSTHTTFQKNIRSLWSTNSGQG